MASRRGGRTARLHAERLEGREMLAGNVSVYTDVDAFSVRHLRIFGDAAANGVSVTQVATGTFDVVGVNRSGATQVNGSFGVQRFSGVTGDVSASLGAGDDFLRVGGFDAVTRDVLPGSLIVYGGDGNDAVSIEWLAFRTAIETVQVVTNTGNDSVSMLQVIGARSINVLTGDGADSVTIRNTDVRNDLSVSTGSGNDSLTVSSITTSTLRAEMGTGIDVASIVTSVFSDAYVNGDLGIDRLNRRGNTRSIRTSGIEIFTAT